MGRDAMWSAVVAMVAHVAIMVHEKSNHSFKSTSDYGKTTRLIWDFKPLFPRHKLEKLHVYMAATRYGRPGIHVRLPNYLNE